MSGADRGGSASTVRGRVNGMDVDAPREPAEPAGSLTLSQVAATLGVAVTRVSQLLRDGQLVAVRDAAGERRVPALMLQDGAVVKSLPAVITLLRDARFADTEIVEWLWHRDDSLPGRPIDALRENRGTEIKRRAQVAGF